ncbi:unnamed protein product [Closterium sp. NIES-53]
MSRASDMKENLAVSRQDLTDAVSCFPNLTHLHLCDGSVETLDDDFLSHPASSCPKLAVLHVGSRIIGEDQENNDDRKHLHPVSEAGLGRLFRQCKQLEVLSLDCLHPNAVFPVSFFQLSQLRIVVLPDASALAAPSFSQLSLLASIRITSMDLVYQHLVNLVQLLRLTDVTIKYDPLVDEPTTIFSVSHLQFLESLQLEGDGFYFSRFFPSGLPCSRLERLVIANCNLDWLPDDLGEILPCLRELTLSWCSGLTRLPDDFASLTQENLAVSRQDLTNAVSCFSNPTHLHLCDGSVETLDDDFLSHPASSCPKLAVLHVGSRIIGEDQENDNDRKHLHPVSEAGLGRLFRQCKQLEVLSLDCLHPNAVFPASFFQLSQLCIVVLPDASALAAPGFSQLLSLASIRITSMDLVYQHLVNLVQLPRLTDVAIKYDPLVDEPTTIFSVSHLQFLESLQLEGDGFYFSRFFPSGLPCSRLERLVIANCNLDWLPDDLGEILPCLRELTLSWCSGLTRLPDDFASLTQLESLTISSCLRFSSLPVEFGHLPALKTLFLRMVALTNLPDSFGNLASLKE